MMARFILTLAMTVWARDEIGRAERTLSLCKIGKQVQNRVAVLAGNDDVPRASLWLDGHGELLSVGGWDVAQVENPSSRLSFSSLRTTPDFLHQRRKYNSQVCTLADAR